MDSEDFLNKPKKPKDDQSQVFALDANSYKIAKALESNEKDLPDDKGGSLKLILDSLRKSEKAREHDIRLAFTLDPRDANLGTISTYRQKTNLTPDPILKRIAGPQGDDLVNQILQARSNTLASFGRPRTSRFSVGFEFQQLHPEPHESPEQQKAVQSRIEKMKEIMWNCGSNRVLEDWHPNLSQYLKMTTRDALLFGRSATEFIYANDTEKGENVCVAFRAVDAGTIYRIIPAASHDQEQRIQAMRMLEKLDDKKFDVSKYEKDEYKWVQVINGTPVQVFTEKELVVYNIFPTTNIEYNGYPLTPIDQALNAVITHISISLQNKLFFENGRAARGMLVFKSDDIDEGTIQKIRNQFHASINSVKNSFRMPVFGIGSDDDIIFQTTDSANRDKEFQFLSDDTARIVLGAFQMSPEELPGYAHLSRGSNSQTLSECLHPNTTVLTDKGMICVSELASVDDGKCLIWDGKDFCKAKVFKTGIKKLTETVLNSNLSIKTSPDHLFRIIDDNGDLNWKAQSLLSVGDVVVTGKKTVSGITKIPFYKDTPLTEDMMELLGWMTGDGSLIGPRKRIGAQIKFYYHQEKEKEICLRHFDIMKSFGLKPIQTEKIISIDEQEKIKTRYGFKSVAKSRVYNTLYDTEFVSWLISVGFNPSKEGKTIPSFLFTAPEEYRCAFLRGLFSADGHVARAANGCVVLTMENDSLRDQTRQLLLTVGIRTVHFQGTTKEVFVGNQRSVTQASNKLMLRDKRVFFEKIGFLQKHKQPEEKWLKGEDPRPSPPSIQKKYIELLLSSDISRKYKRGLYQYRGDFPKSRIHLNKLLLLCSMSNIETPNWLNDYNFDFVESVINHNTEVEMYDVTMYNNDHSFQANGIIVHNSSNEYKLIAARDVGLRPLMYDIQDLLNTHILPKFDEQFSKEFQLILAGLEQDDPEKESTRLSQDMNIHMNMDDILKTVEKPVLGKELGGQFIMNQAWQTSVAPYLTVGFIMEAFFGIEGAAQDPRYDYIRDPFYFQQMQLAIQKSQMAMQNQQMAMQMQMPQQQPQPGQDGQDSGQEASGGQDTSQPAQKSELAGTFAELNKSVETNHTAISKMLLARHNQIVDKNLLAWRKDSEKAVRKIVADIQNGTLAKHEDHEGCDHDHDVDG